MHAYGALLAALVAGATVLGFVLWEVYESRSPSRNPSASAIPVSAEPDAEEEGDPPAADPVEPQVQLAPDSAQEAAFFNEAYRLTPLRGLQYQDPLNFAKATPEELSGYWQAQVDLFYPADTLERMGVAYQLAGLLDVDVDLSREVSRLFPMAETCLYDPSSGKIFYTDACDPADPLSRRELTEQLLLLLLDQNHGWHESQWLPEAHADRAWAQRAFYLADALWHAGKALEVEELRAPDTSVPRLLREWHAMPAEAGVAFCEALSQAEISLDAVYQNLPTTLAHLLHPERFLQTPRYRPRGIAWPHIQFRKTEPSWDNIVGELHLRSLLRDRLPQEEADTLAAAWDGDRLALFLVDDTGPQLVWKLMWRDEASAERALQAFSEHAVPLFGVRADQREARDDGVVAYHSQLSLLLERQGDALHVLRSTDPALLIELQAYARDAQGR